MAYTVTLPPTVALALGIDDPELRRELEYDVVSTSRARWVVELGSTLAAWTLLHDVNSRAEWSTAEWDQPVSWRRACRKVLPKLAASLLPALPKGSPAEALAAQIVRTGRD